MTTEEWLAAMYKALSQGKPLEDLRKRHANYAVTCAANGYYTMLRWLEIDLPHELIVTPEYTCSPAILQKTRQEARKAGGVKRWLKTEPLLFELYVAFAPVRRKLEGACLVSWQGRVRDTVARESGLSVFPCVVGVSSPEYKEIVRVREK